MSRRSPSSAFLTSVSAIVLIVAACISGGPVRAQVIDIVSLDLSGIPAGTPLVTVLGIRDSFYLGERFWESRLVGFSAQLPGLVQRSVRPIQITASIVPIDGPGGVLGQAGPTQLFSYTGTKPYVITQAAVMQFDSDDAVAFQNLGLFDDIVRHEMAHALGFGTVWTDNRLNLGPFGHFTGSFALKRFRIEAKRPSAMFVPVEQFGGPGTAGGHWDSLDPFFFNATKNSGDLMIGYITDIPTVSETTWAQFADLGYKVKGINDKLVGSKPGSGGTKSIPIN